MLFWFSFPLWPRFLSISSCTFWTFVLLYLRIVYSAHLLVFLIFCEFSICLLILCQMNNYQRFLPFHRLSLKSSDYFLSGVEAFLVWCSPICQFFSFFFLLLFWWGGILWHLHRSLKCINYIILEILPP
jgi:hypothetical protein